MGRSGRVLEGVKIGGSGGDEEDSHPHAHAYEQDEQDQKHEKIQTAPLVKRLLVSKKLPEYMRKDGEASARSASAR